MALPRSPRNAKLPLLASVAFTFLSPPAAVAQEPPRPVDTSAFGKIGAACAELRYADFSTIEDAMTQVTSARPVAGADGTPDYCEVEGYIWRATRFRLRFPLENWNRKMVVQGGGGQTGDLPNDPQARSGRAAPLRKGYAVVNQNGGHFSTLTDTKWSYFNEPAMIDFGMRTPYVVSVASKAILAHVFGEKPRRAYFEGCSNGGREAMMMAQRFPWEFDGVIAGAPSIDVRGLTINLFHGAALLRDQSRAGFDLAAAQTLHKGAIGQCDKLDGKLDGLIGDPRVCKVDFRPLMCKGEASTSCLTERQADIARQMYAGPRNAAGQPFTARSAYPGSELSWISFITPRWTIDYGNELMRAALYPPPPPGWIPDPARLEDYAKRMGVIEGLTAPTNPDLTQFNAAGGKMIAYYGWTDAFGGADAIMNYYEAAERVGGGEEATQDYFRLFMMPGMDHCGGGEGAFVYDYLGELDKWVESGKAPASLTGFHPGPEGKPQFSATVVPYRSKRQ
ncbi:tannase/feruloyl esterase family alpha/beta hydrolase [Sphingopyxis sp.]|uniref:tannase/feruloyl esterase family alpha/beta hydrolase n=1 Tax=Sphingopyxis sp. TaxID=1908224 RepID=UPI002B46D4B0|nr:tannase/feruloyl esterase family alpha/beta hydrolase [Sphingopyxis sp.]HJS12956.1 tannase/feruloyl esterase family alpha/beta hydrolase [Sphingopyxis sp.]